jgi:hypothetical protein
LPPSAARAAGQSKAQGAATNEISVVQITCRAVNWTHVFPAANSELANTVLRELLASPSYAGGANGTGLTGWMEQDPVTGTFSFEARLKLKKPIKL